MTAEPEHRGPQDGPDLAALQRRHLRFGWTSLFVFVLLGGLLEAMHGLKVYWYLAVGNETQRLLWRLAHAHGTMLALVHIAFAVSLAHVSGRLPKIASPCLVGTSIALPGGFLLGALGVQGGDPGLGIALVPLGLVLLLVAIGSTLRSLRG